MFFGTVEKPPRLSEFDLEIPEKLIAKNPSKKRDECKLMVLNRKDKTIEHKKFSNIVDHLRKNDLLILKSKEGSKKNGIDILFDLFQRTL